jgi:hypothetical protein
VARCSRAARCGHRRRRRGSGRAVAGAAVGAAAQILTKGKRIHVPDETLLNYRLQSGLDLDVRDTGYERDGFHYHKFD